MTGRLAKLQCAVGMHNTIEIFLYNRVLHSLRVKHHALSKTPHPHHGWVIFLILIMTPRCTEMTLLGINTVF